MSIPPPSAPRPSEILPASGKEPALIASVLRAESARGEQVVATIRAGFITLLVAVSPFIFARGAQDESARGGNQPSAWLFWVGYLVFSWLWFAMLRLRPYRPLFSYVSVVADTLFVAGATWTTFAWSSGAGTLFFWLGGAPAMLLLFYNLSAAGVRFNAGATVLTGVLSFATFTAMVVRASRAAPGLSYELLTGLPTGPMWVLRGICLAGTAVLIGMAGTNARRMVERAGRATLDHARVVSLFGQYVEPEIARDALSGVRRAEIREVTVLFTDLRDFTAMSEQLTPEQVLEILNAHYESIVPAVHRHGGTVNKFIGDAIMATFGAPTPRADHALRAVKAAQEMLELTTGLNQELLRRGLPALRMGVGIATGPVVVGTLGALDRVEYAVLGDTVNTASRLESLNKEAHTELLMAASTWALVREALPTRKVGEFAVKGKARLVEVYSLTGAEASPG